MTLKDKLKRKKEFVRFELRLPLDLEDQLVTAVNLAESNKSEITREALERCLPGMIRELRAA